MTTFPRQHIAEQISDLRHMRNHLSDIMTTACSLLREAKDAPAEIRAAALAAIEIADIADKVAKERISQLYNSPTPAAAANANEERAA